MGTPRRIAAAVGKEIAMQTKGFWRTLVSIVLTLVVGACVTARSPRLPGSNVQKSNLTPGMVKARVVEGQTTQTEILEWFGAPNIITRNKDGKEVWTYDRQYTATAAEVASWRTGWAGGVGGVGTTEPVGALGGASGESSKTSTVSQTTSGTVTWMIIFDEEDVVEKHKLNWTAF